jgi:malonate decarboxylase epsilon subunit
VHESVTATLEQARQVLERDVMQLDTEAALESTVSVQLATLIAGVSYTRLLAANDTTPDAVAGLSVGAFAAAVASGAIGFADALRLVRLRSEAMQRSYGRGGYGMLAILGLPEAATQTLIEAIARPTMPLHLSSVNAPAEMVLAGSEPALAAAATAAQGLGGRARSLRVSVPSHCALLGGVAALLREAMRKVRIDRPRVPYISNHRARALYDGQSIAEDLILTVSHTVRWHDCVTLLYELGSRLFIEAPPGHALSNLVRAEFPDARALAAADVEVASVIQSVRLGCTGAALGH